MRYQAGHPCSTLYGNPGTCKGVQGLTGILVGVGALMRGASLSMRALPACVGAGILLGVCAWRCTRSLAESWPADPVPGLAASAQVPTNWLAGPFACAAAALSAALLAAASALHTYPILLSGEEQ